jgi:4-hydroxybenzoate polyprenyltransferase
MAQTRSQKQSKALISDQPFMETIVVASEILYFLETIYHNVSYLKTLPCQLPTHFFYGSQTLPLMQGLVSIYEIIYHTSSFLKTLYLFTASDFPTFALPTVLFGVFGALSGTVLTTNSSPSLVVAARRIPLALLLIWINLLIFNISNQSTPSAVVEDAVNKPHRPIPTRRITIERARQLNLVLVPVVLVLSWATGVWHSTLLLLAMQWMYNDLRGCDESLLLRNGLIAIGYGLYSTIALAIIMGTPYEITATGYEWITMVALVMFTTQHICDIKDAPGDRLRGRRSAPIVLGDAGCRWSVCLSIMVCSAMCPTVFGLGGLSYVFTIFFGGTVAGRTLFLRNPAADKRTWKLWAGWTCSLYVLPLIARL